MADKGNTIISDGLSSYIYLDNPNNDYTHVKHIHSAGFGVGILSTSHIESIYMGTDKIKKNETYHSIPNKYIVHNEKGAEFKIGLKNKSAEDKIIFLE